MSTVKAILSRFAGSDLYQRGASKIRTKLILGFLFVSVLPVLILGILFSRASSRATVNQTSHQLDL